MKLKKSMERIESLEFQANYSVLSGFRTVISAFAIDEDLKGLAKLLQDNPEKQAALFHHLESLVRAENPEQLHPHDISVAAYLYVMEQVLAPETLAQWVKTIQSTDNFWWARKMAEKISSEKLQNLPN